MSKHGDRLHDRIGNFTTIPNSVIKRARKLGSHALTLFVYLRYRTNQKTETAYPSYTTIHDDTGLTRTSIAKSILKLETEKLLTRRRRFSSSTIYTLHSGFTISPESRLMKSSISPDSGLPLVQNQDANKIELTRSRGGAAPARKRASKSVRELAREIENVFALDLDREGDQLAQRLIDKHNATPAQVKTFASWWKHKDWRGKKGDSPTVNQIKQHWAQAFIAPKKNYR